MTTPTHRFTLIAEDRAAAVAVISLVDRAIRQCDIDWLRETWEPPTHTTQRRWQGMPTDRGEELGDGRFTKKAHLEQLVEPRTFRAFTRGTGGRAADTQHDTTTCPQPISMQKPKTKPDAATIAPSPGSLVPMIALLRGINVGGKHPLAMKDLALIATKLKLLHVSTYINSGNLLFASEQPPSLIETALESALEKRCGFAIPVVIRTLSQWSEYANSTPFLEAQQTRANLLHLALSKAAPLANTVATLSLKAVSNEQLALARDALWIDYVEGAGRSKITPAHIDKATGSPTTSRNFNTVQKLHTLLSALSAELSKS